MNVLDYLRLANGGSGGGKGKPLAINLITNFTDAVLQKLLMGVLISEGFSPEIFAVPYKQYHLHLSDAKSKLQERKADITFIFFDINPYKRGAFDADVAHVSEVLSDIERYVEEHDAPAVMMTFIHPYAGVYGNLFAESPKYKFVSEANAKLADMGTLHKNFHTLDTNALLARHGEHRVRDFRGLYAFDIPFTNEFLLDVACEWASYARLISGRVTKCIVLDLDNTLWGGVVGELGPLGIQLGTEYPGIAFQNFQYALRELSERGIILAVNSKNNIEDVREAWNKNPHMILKEENFAAVRVNWQDKAKNLIEISEELNIGLDSMVFLDDDAINRGLVREMLPEVLVPEIPPEPELYIPTLYGLTAFNLLSITKEDKEKAKMYQEETKRKAVQYSTKSVDEYISALGISMEFKKNDLASAPRIAQLTQKTNQWNMTTKRYAEKEIVAITKKGAHLYSADVSDKFGDYGKTVLAIVKVGDKKTVDLDTLLMSCRVMGRHVEHGFLLALAKSLKEEGFTALTASFVPTAKNAPAKDFFTSVSFRETHRDGASVFYSVPISELIDVLTPICQTITII